MNPKSNTQNQSNNSPSHQQADQFAHQLQQINNYMIPQSQQQIQLQHSNSTSNIHMGNQGYAQRIHSQSMSPTNKQIIQNTFVNQGLNIQPQGMMLNSGGNGYQHQQSTTNAFMNPNIIQNQRHMSTDNILVHTQFQHPTPQIQPNLIINPQSMMSSGNLHQYQHPSSISPTHRMNPQQFSVFHQPQPQTQPQHQQVQQHLSFNNAMNGAVNTHNTFMISPRQIVQDLSPMEPLRNKSLSYDNSSLNWNASISTALSKQSTSNVNQGGFTSSSLNTAFAGSSGNGFNYMLISPAIYDEDVIEEQFEENSYLHNQMAVSVSGPAFQ